MTAGSVFLLALVVLVGYFIPSMIALARGHNSQAAIFVLNLLLGWTVLGWLIALIWSFTGSASPVRSTSSPPPSAAQGFCPSCGAARTTGAFCPGCGAKLG